MIKEKIEIIYESIVEEGIKVYHELYESIEVSDDTIDYWNKAIELYRTFDATEKTVFYDIIKQVIIDTTASIFGLLDGSNSLPGGGTFETDIRIDGIDSEHFLQDYFLSLVEEKQKSNNLKREKDK